LGGPLLRPTIARSRGVAPRYWAVLFACSSGVAGEPPLDELPESPADPPSPAAPPMPVDSFAAPVDPPLAELVWPLDGPPLVALPLLAPRAPLLWLPPALIGMRRDWACAAFGNVRRTGR
jgi:hypothetical protein